MRAVLVGYEALMARRRRLVDARGSGDFALAAVEAIERGDGPYVWIGTHGFRWECPGCGHLYAGNLGEEPESGWEHPVWVLSGAAGRPTLEPSLGCPRWRDGVCPEGHWRLRSGDLVAV